MPYGVIGRYAVQRKCRWRIWSNHRGDDRDKAEVAAPVVSISLGDSCCFRYGGLRRGDPAKRLELRSGDVVVMGGAARLMFHSIDKIFGGSSGLLPGGRINLTLRRVTRP